MRRRATAAALVVVGLALVWVGAASAATTHRVAIASFQFAPPTIEIQTGDVVEWTNVDPVVHTVTDEQGRFASGHMRQGQTYSLTFTSPGRIYYFCETHDDMRAEVVVVPTGAMTAPTTVVAPPATAAAPVTTTSKPPAVPIAAVPPTPSARTEVLAEPGAPLNTASGITGGLVTGGSDALPAPLVATGLLLLTLSLLVALMRAGVMPADATLWCAAALTLAAGGFHAQLKLTIDYPEPIGTFMVVAAAAAVLVAAYLVIAPWDWTVPLAGAAFHGVSLAAFAASRFGSLFGYHEVGLDPSPQATATVTAEAAALVLIAASVWLRRGQAALVRRVS